MSSPPDTLLRELDEVNARFETATPREILAWTFARFHDDVVMACSFEDLALLDMVRELRPSTDIIFLDTLGHFRATLDFVELVAREWSLSLVTTTPDVDADAWPCGSERCCELRKVAPLRRAVAGRSAWITALKRVDASGRASMKTVTWDGKFGLVKVNPLATWSDEDVTYYLRSRRLREHPLWAEGYASIGCAAVTAKPLTPGDRRSGRWASADQQECGLHEL